MSNIIPSFSYSQINTFQRCQYAWQLSYKEGLQPRIDNPKPQLGTAIHRGLEAGLLGESVSAEVDVWADEAMKYLKPEEEVVIFDQKVLAKSIALRTLASFYDAGFEVMQGPKGTPLEGPMIERELKVPLSLSFDSRLYHFKGYVDVVARERFSGHLWTIDFKSRESFAPEDSEEYSLQMAVYQYMLLLLGVDTKGSIAWQTKSTVPREPKLNKGGKSMSRAAITTTWALYEAALKAAGLDPAEYGEMKEKLEEVQWQRLSRAYRGPKEIAAIWEQIVTPVTIQILIANEAPGDRPRTLNAFNCRGCQYKDLCMEGLRGGDTDFLREQRYIKRGEEPTPRMVGTPDFEDDMGPTE